MGDVDEMMAAEIGAVFVPCGLGHLIGRNTYIDLKSPIITINGRITLYNAV